MKVTLVCCGRLENRYAIEFVEHYKQLGFDHIFIADNNREGEEHFEDVLQSYIDNGFVTIYDYRNNTCVQGYAYKEIYNEIHKKYDWIFFCDFDEFLILEKDKNIKEYLNRECFKDANQILINWKIYTDNDLVEDDGRPCLERFTIPMDLDKHIQYGYPENFHVKPIIKTVIRKLKHQNPHICDNDKFKDSTYSSIGEKTNITPFIQYNYDLAYIKHFTTKTIDEWINNKLKRGVGDRNQIRFNGSYNIERFFKYNNLTQEKIDYIKNKGIDISRLNQEYYR